jgi:ATP-dependent RNA helicase MSS116, mitochondrial
VKNKLGTGLTKFFSSMQFSQLKVLHTLAAYRYGTLQTSNLICSPIYTRLIHARGIIKREFQSTVQQWKEIPKRPEPIYSAFRDMKLNEKTVKALHEDFGYTSMTTVQQKVLELGSNQNDLLVRAKTGTGKTLAFMIAAVERVLKQDGFAADKIPILVISPARELTVQIAKEAEKLVKHHHLRVETVVGGMGRARQVEKISRNKVDIIVGTPGRLADIISSEPKIRAKLDGLHVLVFDEADMLLEMGFRKEMEKIVSYLPSNRATFMFSATLSTPIRSIASVLLQRGYKDIDTVPKNEVETHMKIRQSYLIVPFKDQLYILQEIIRKHKETVPHSKIIVFFPTTTLVAYTAQILNGIQSMDVMQIHSKLGQPQRIRISDQFRRSRSSVLVTTDVSARGVDYPGVTLVLQLGLPSSREQYVHRIGRTGRAEKEGEAILMLSPYEEKYLECVKDLPIRKELRFNLLPNGRNKEILEDIKKMTEKMDRNEKNSVYTSMIGFR